MNDDQQEQDATEYEWSEDTWRGVAELAAMAGRLQGVENWTALELATLFRSAERFECDHLPHHADELAMMLRLAAKRFEHLADCLATWHPDGLN